MEITLLGTGCMVPTKDRNASGIYIEIEGKGILFDCGEGTQRQMSIAGIPRTKIKYIFISHWHADHTAGLLGLIQTIGSSTEDPNLEIFGPTGTKEMFRNLMNACVFENRMNIKVHEFNCPKEKTIFKNELFSVKSINLNHSVPCIGFKIIEADKRKLKLKKIEELGVPAGPLRAILQKGKDIEYNSKIIKSNEVTNLKKGKIFTYIADTGMTSNAIKLANESDLILSESTFTKQHQEKAESFLHLTSEEAAQIASLSNSERLILTHFSQRYKTYDVHLEEARDIFPNTEIGFDFMKIKLK